MPAKPRNGVSTLQMFLWPTMFAAVKSSADYPDFRTFYTSLPDILPQNSPETRKRVANLVVRAYFPRRTLDELPTLAWRSYRNEDLLTELMRVYTLEAEPLVAGFVTRQVLAQAPGDAFDLATARDYVSSAYGGFNAKSYERLRTMLAYLGFIRRHSSGWLVAAIPQPSLALLLLLHARLAPSPRIVRLSDLLAEPFWRYLGLRCPSQVRTILHDAQTTGLIARYVQVDELEQVTTRYSLGELLEQARHP